VLVVEASVQEGLKTPTVPPHPVARYALPEWYYSNGCYVGPVFSAGYCGAYAVPVYSTFYNRSSRYNYWSSRAYIHNTPFSFRPVFRLR